MKRLVLPFSTILLAGVTGCGNDNDRSSGASVSNPIQHVGYYSNENHSNQRNSLFRDHDGPVTEMMDHTFGDEDQIVNEQREKLLQTRDENGHPPNPTKPLATEDRNFFLRDNRFSRSDMNYHDHLNRNIANTGTSVNNEFQDDVTDSIRNRVADVDNVRGIRSVSYGNSIIIAVTFMDNSKAAETKRAIQKAVRPLVAGKAINVISDEGTLGRDRNIHNDVPQRKPLENKK
ncbi:YhcN/YlaJ family sporulation lipoprotein [Bacillus rubiinfantis]|uniref:YhcN/YlaJ family sporulation lipoprotein n=1 Tax=Bacillus rubiinfantis TaxID=1499680 RepID=UPI001FE822D1|nr:YhcN/YlaJ family sporulation lipoprotein [Bacillus rubiinfantis]